MGECVAADGHQWVITGAHLSLSGPSLIWQECRVCGVTGLWSPNGDGEVPDRG